MASAKRNSEFETFISNIIDLYEVDDIGRKIFVIDCFLNFINSVVSSEDIQRFLCLPKDVSDVAIVYVGLFKKQLSLIEGDNAVYRYLMFPPSIEQNAMMSVGVNQKNEIPVHKNIMDNCNLTFYQVQTRMLYFWKTLENAIYKKLVEYINTCGPCSLDFGFEGQNSIYELNLTPVSCNALKKLHFDTIQEITHFSANEFFSIEGVGDSLYRNVVKALSECGFSFRDDKTSCEENNNLPHKSI